ncbi:MAG TPA: pilus assembly protein N-terminal domain-containing protein [Acetobacteraceae bacterium]|jgi:pilus assembly protein CpaC
MTTALRPALLAILLLTLPALSLRPAHAQTADPRGFVSLFVSEGRLLRLDQNMSNVLVGDNSIADVQVVSPRELYVYGRKPGQTMLRTAGAACRCPWNAAGSGAADHVKPRHRGRCVSRTR